MYITTLNYQFDLAAIIVSLREVFSGYIYNSKSADSSKRSAIGIWEAKMQKPDIELEPT
ncbi:hypothetical protein KAU11_07695 [Candidatus Babeliales bacterium]|nr:hypothetical protein [Candidatus Babeliales bacterium]